MSVFEYKGYLGSAEVDTESLALVGRLLFIRDAIAYSANDALSLKAAFEEAVDEYLTNCAELGDQPDTPCKGTFNVRVGPARHRKVALLARAKDIGLNDFICQALDAACGAPEQHHHYVTIEAADAHSTRVVASTTESTRWEASNVRTH